MNSIHQAVLVYQVNVASHYRNQCKFWSINETKKGEGSGIRSMRFNIPGIPTSLAPKKKKRHMKFIIQRSVSRASAEPHLSSKTSAIHPQARVPEIPATHSTQTAHPELK